jgi:MoxR-like ATPase
MIKLKVGYPSVKEEAEILRRRRERQQEEVELRQVTNVEQVLELCSLVETIHIDPDLEEYIASLVSETRRDRRVAVGASPRASLAFLKMARAHAALLGREYVLPDDIKRFAVPVLSHRLILQPEHWMSHQVAEDVISDVFAKVAVPVLPPRVDSTGSGV